jgi:hypothetical protein
MQPAVRLHLEQLEHRNLPSGIVYHGGPILQHTKVEVLFYGSYWTTTAGVQREAALKTAITSLIGGSYMDQLGQLAPVPVGRGSLDQVDVVPAIVLTGPITGIANIIRSEINVGHLPAPGSQTCYLLMGPPNHGTGGEYHSWFYRRAGVTSSTHVYYAVVPFQFNNGVPTTSLQSETWGFTHELVETATDPDTLATGNGSGYWFPSPVPANNNEICDVAEAENLNFPGTWQTSTGTYVVSPYWIALQRTWPPDAYFASLATAHKKNDLTAGVAFSDFDN